MKVSGPLSQFKETPYQGKFAQFIGLKGHKALMLSERLLALPLYKSWVLTQHEPSYKEKKFRAELFVDETDHDDAVFRLDLDQEREYTEYLEEKGVIKSVSKWREEVSRAAQIVGNIAFAGVTAPISLPAGAIGIASRYATQNRMNEVVCLKPAGINVWDGRTDLKIFTTNMACTEFMIMDDINQVPRTKPRVKDWARHLLSLDADVICLQEAFDFDDILSEVGKKLQENGYYVMMTTKRAEVFGMTGGLMMAVRIGKVVRVGYEEYENRVSWDKRAAKGGLAGLIQLNDEVTICIVTTHMQAGCPKGWSDEDRIAIKATQFHQVRRFTNRFVDGFDVRDIFLVGDFNDSRFKQLSVKDLDQVMLNPTYEAIVDGLLSPASELSGFKDLTVPNIEDTFATYLEKETEFNPISENEERGIPEGTCFNTAATSYHYFIELVSHQVADSTGLSAKKAKRMVKKRLADKPLKKIKYTTAIDDMIDEVKDRMYRKPNTTDHVTFMENEHNAFSEVNYDYKAMTFAGKGGLDTDHVSLLLTIQPNA